MNWKLFAWVLKWKCPQRSSRKKASQNLNEATMSVFGLGILFLLLSIIGLMLTILNFEWMKKHVPCILYWGRSSWRFPASQVGVSIGFMLGIVLGIFCLDSGFQLLSERAWFSVMTVIFTSVILAGIRDYFIYRKLKRMP